MNPVYVFRMTFKQMEIYMFFKMKNDNILLLCKQLKVYHVNKSYETILDFMFSVFDNNRIV